METATQPWLYASACLRYDLSTESGKTGLTLATGSGHSSSTATGHIKSKGDAAKRFTEFGKFIEWDSWVLAAARLISGTGSAAGIHEVAQCEAAPQAAGSGQAVRVPSQQAVGVQGAPSGSSWPLRRSLTAFHPSATLPRLIPSSASCLQQLLNCLSFLVSMLGNCAWQSRSWDSKNPGSSLQETLPKCVALLLMDPQDSRRLLTRTWPKPAFLK